MLLDAGLGGNSWLFTGRFHEFQYSKYSGGDTPSHTSGACYTAGMTQETALALMQTGKNIFLTGAPGSGKTYTLNRYLAYLKDYGIEAAVTAPTGIAASHIGGVTIQSFFGTGIKDNLSPWDIENLTEKKYLWERMKDLKVLVIDEVSMPSPELFESIDRLLKTFKFSNESFGGIQVILVGDFFQLPPVSKIKRERRFVFQTDTWNELGLSTCYLETAYRHTDEILLRILNEMRSGNVSEEAMNHFRSRYKKDIDGGSAVTKLFTHNANVDEMNTHELAKLDVPLKKFEAHSSGQKKWVEKIFNNSLLIPELSLKQGALVFFIKNNYDKGYINGTLGTVIDFDTFGVPIVETRTGKRIKADREEWVFEDTDGKPKAVIKQIPLRLAWAITVHKSQGMTLDAAEIDLSGAFEPGQGYVALSRIKSLSGLKLMGLNQAALSVDRNVLVIDSNMQSDSTSHRQLWESMNQHEREELIENYMGRLGGSKEKGVTKKEKTKKISASKQTKSFLESKPFFEQQMTLEEIAEERGLTEATVMKHLTLILQEDPEFDISYLQPNSKIISAVEQAVAKINKRNNPEDFSDKDGALKLKPIFTELDEKISYEDIKKALLFLE